MFSYIISLKIKAFYIFISFYYFYPDKSPYYIVIK